MKRAVVVGGAACVWCDIEDLRDMVGTTWGRWAIIDHKKIAREKGLDDPKPCERHGKTWHIYPVDPPVGMTIINDIGTTLPPMDHWVSLHPEKLTGTDPDHPEGWSWDRQRLEKGLSDGYVTWCHKPDRGTMRWVKPFGGGSSGMLAVSVAWELGCERIVCCGVPLDYGGWFDESLTHEGDEHFTSYKSHRRAWKRREDTLVKRVRSMSGWTRELLGAPTPEWLGVDDG